MKTKKQAKPKTYYDVEILERNGQWFYGEGYGTLGEARRHVRLCCKASQLERADLRIVKRAGEVVR